MRVNIADVRLPLVIDIEARPFERLVADVAVAGVCSDDRPLRGGAARADWRLCGVISRLLIDERVTGAPGEAMLMPCDGRLRAPRLLIVGLGPRASRKADEVKGVARDALDRVIGLGLETVAVGPLGFAGDDWPRHAHAIVEAAIEAVDASGGSLDLRLAVSSASEARVRASVTAVVDALGRGDVRVARRDERGVDDAPPRARRAPQGQPGLHRAP